MVYTVANSALCTFSTQKVTNKNTKVTKEKLGCSLNYEQLLSWQATVSKPVLQHFTQPTHTTIPRPHTHIAALPDAFE